MAHAADGAYTEIKPAKDDYCEQCEARLFDIDFHKDKTPLKTGETEYQGCIFCDQLLAPFIEAG